MDKQPCAPPSLERLMDKESQRTATQNEGDWVSILLVKLGVTLGKLPSEFFLLLNGK